MLSVPKPTSSWTMQYCYVYYHLLGRTYTERQRHAKLNVSLIFAPSMYTVCVSDIFDLFDVMCKQHHKTALNPSLNGTKKINVHDTCKRSPSSTSNPPRIHLKVTLPSRSLSLNTNEPFRQYNFSKQTVTASWILLQRFWDGPYL